MMGKPRHTILCCAVWILTTGGSPATETPPNVLWLSTEDIGPHLGCYGDSVAQTPNLDRLARQGMVYDVAWSNYPVCAPARTTIIAGVYPAATGAGNMRSSVPLPDPIRMFPQYLRERGYYCTNNSKEDYNYIKPKQVWDASSRQAHWRNRAEGQPFFAIFNYTGTHESKIRSRPHAGVTDPANVRVPAYHPDRLEVRQDWAQYYDTIATMDGWVRKHLDELQEAGLANNTIVIFFGDHGSGMPRHKRYAGDSGMRVPFLLYVPKSLRRLAPREYSPGARSQRPVGFVDLAPSMLSLADIRPPEHLQGHAFLGHYESPPPKYAYGFRGRMDERPDFSRSLRDPRYLYIRNYSPHRPHGQELNYQMQTPTTRVWKKMFDAGQLNDVQSAFWRTKPAEELYDLMEDPDETTNLADDPRQTATLHRFQVELFRSSQRIRDVGFIPEPQLYEIYQQQSPYDYARDATRYPLTEVLKVADRATRRDTPLQPWFDPAIKSSHGVIRYWAVTGILVRGAEAVESHQQLLLKSLEDPWPSVRIVAAEALGMYGDDPSRARALQTLADRADLRNGNHYTALWALNSINVSGARAEPIWGALSDLPVQAAGVKRGGGYVQRMMSRLAPLSDSRAP